MASNWSGFVKYYFHDYFKEQQKIKESISSGGNGEIQCSDSLSNKPTLRLAPTYRLESKKPVNREKCEKIIQRIINKGTNDFTYNSKQAHLLAQKLCEDIKNEIKNEEFDRYKLICIVTIGERFYQSYDSMHSYLWDADKDGSISYVYDTPNYFIVATLYYLYFD